MGYDPYLAVKAQDGWVEILALEKGERKVISSKNPLSILDYLISKNEDFSFDPYISSFFPFLGGAIGYFSYDLGKMIEDLPNIAKDDLGIPKFYFSFHKKVLTFDHKFGKWFLLSIDKDCDLGFEEERIKSILKKGDINTKRGKSGKIYGNFTQKGYMEAVKRVKDYIFSGDVYQVNLSQRFSKKIDVDPYLVYLRLVSTNPSPFAAYLNFPELKVLSSSPERFLRIIGNFVETRPIKGTRPKKSDQYKNFFLKGELLYSRKDKAELNMIVDLERNDLGRICEYGSVKVKEHAVVETYPTVYHTVSTVIGKLLGNWTIESLIKATFPGGSITGAPKIRAMEIIEELEPTKRGIYTGSIGYISFDRSIDLNIVIRTIVIKDNVAYLQVGGGIVADSDEKDEYLETLYKAKALFLSLNL